MPGPPQTHRDFHRQKEQHYGFRNQEEHPGAGGSDSEEEDGGGVNTKPSGNEIINEVEEVDDSADIENDAEIKKEPNPEKADEK